MESSVRVGLSWPGEREPSRHDVESANEQPTIAFLAEFKDALLSSSDHDAVRHFGSQFGVSLSKLTSWQSYHTTWPLAILKDFPQLPTEDRMNQLHESFVAMLPGYMFLSRLPFNAPSHGLLAPPLRLAMACLGAISLQNSGQEANDLFIAGNGLWVVTMETDNREARSLNMVMAGVLLLTYGIMTCDNQIRKRTGLLLSALLTVKLAPFPYDTSIVRRMRLNDRSQLITLLGPRAVPYSTLVWHLWLNDVIRSLHENLPGTFSPSELQTNMPSSSHEFQKVYKDLVQESRSDGSQSDLPDDVVSQEDALLLLVAILSDAITLRLSLGSVIRATERIEGASPAASYNRFLPLAPATEFDRMRRTLSSALYKWQLRFESTMPEVTMALSHYCRLYISCSHLPYFTLFATYPHGQGRLFNGCLGSSTVHDMQLEERSLLDAWTILDAVASRPKSPVDVCPPWIPVITFHAALIVWLSAVQGTTAHNRHGTRRALLAFTAEIESMPWPCCEEMLKTLEGLMS